MRKVLPNQTPINPPCFKHQLSPNDIIGIQSHASGSKAFFRRDVDIDEYKWQTFTLIPVDNLTTGRKWFRDNGDITIEVIHNSDNNFLKPFDFYVFENQREMLTWLAE